MMHGRPPRGSAGDRVVAVLVPRRSTLRRSSDRWEVAARWAALVVLVLLVPLMLQLGAARSDQVREQAAVLRATSHEVTGTVTSVVARRAAGGSGGTDVIIVSWHEPDGSGHSAPRVAVDSPPAVGAPYTFWVDPGLRPVPSPPTEQDAVLQGYVADVGALAGTLVVLVVALRYVRRRLDRQRLRRWDEDWVAFRCRRDRGAAG